MKKRVLIIFVLCLLLLCACKTEYKDPPAPKPDIDPQQTVPDVPNTPDTPAVPDNTDNTDNTDTPDTPVSSDTPDGKFPYTAQLHASFSLYAEPSYDSYITGIVGKTDLYTITDEQTDDDKNLWGKIEENCWVDLTYAHAFFEDMPPVAIYGADRSVVENEHHECYLTDLTDGVKVIAVCALEKLTDLSFTALTWSDGGYQELETYCSLPELTSDKPLVLRVMFSGSFSLYGISFSDENGTERYYALSESGRNGELHVAEYTK